MFADVEQIRELKVTNSDLRQFNDDLTGTITETLIWISLHSLLSLCLARTASLEEALDEAKKKHSADMKLEPKKARVARPDRQNSERVVASVKEAVKELHKLSAKKLDKSHKGTAQFIVTDAAQLCNVTCCFFFYFDTCQGKNWYLVHDA